MEDRARALKLHPNLPFGPEDRVLGDQCLLQGGAYGRVDGPYLWYKSWSTLLGILRIRCLSLRQLFVQFSDWGRREATRKGNAWDP